MAVLLHLSASQAFARDLRVDGPDWQARVGSGVLRQAAALRADVVLESGEAIGTLRLNHAALGKGDATAAATWRVEVMVVESTLPDGVRVEIRRTDEGEGRGEVQQGDAYMTCEALPRFWFRGSGDRDTIGFAYRLSGLAVTTPPGNYHVTLMIRVYDE